MHLFQYVTTTLVLPALLTASQVPITALVHHDSTNNKTISKSLFVELEELARIVDIAYCVGVPGAGISQPFQCLSRCKDFASFELVTAWNTGPLLSDSCGYIALSHEPSSKRIIVAFRGTYSIANTIADLSTWPQEYVPYPADPPAGAQALECRNCSVHMGFYQSWKNTRDVIGTDVQLLVEDYPDYQLVLVGHSLGGAVAALAGIEFDALGYAPQITTFGEPRLGNQGLVDYIDERFHLLVNQSVTNSGRDSRFRRVTHVNDPVPLLPLDEWGYQPHAGEIFISKSDLSPEQEDLRYCVGDQDESCSIERAQDGFRWALPTRYKIWQLFFAHRDYFWRLGLCVPEIGWPQKWSVSWRWHRKAITPD